MERGDELNMAHRESHHEIASRWQHYPAGLEAAAESLQRRGDIRKGGIKSWIGDVIERWDKSMPSPGEEFRTDESVREQHFLASLPQREWRVPYGADGYAGWQLMREIQRRRKCGISLEGLAWPPSDDPYAPANDPNHPYFLPKESES
jgi:hypothetical protein